ncbi:nickel-responsive transcriptional regulator NikR [Breoghania sp. JC706]|uniref:nickel-responsive transcriptional regulator NikR n=1 Tax=Breoghania sp. JC706 TaxID=3117732 RepID=UPI003009C4D2
MQRITITIDDDLAAELDAHMAATGTSGRSEAIRDLVRRGLATVRSGPGDERCYGVVSCAVDQSVRQLAARIPQGRLDRHDQTVAALSVPLDHTTSIDVAVMRGRVADVTAYAEALFLERGVMHGSLGLIPVAEDTTTHVHEHDHSHEHTHYKVQSSL